MTNILSRNSKTRYSLNFPAPDTCSRACPVMDICYAQKGRFCTPNVREANDWRLHLATKRPKEFFKRFDQEVKKLLDRKISIKYLRIFGSGDRPDLEFTSGMLRVVESNSRMNFWVSSVKLKHSETAPDNLLVRNSIGKGPYTSAVWRKGTPEPEEGLICPATTGEVKDCEECGHKCWSRDVKHVWYKEH